MSRQLSDLREVNSNWLYLSKKFIIDMDYIYEDIRKLQRVVIYV